MKTILASVAVAAAVLGTAVPASAQFFTDDAYVAAPYYGSGYYWGGPRVYVAPPAYVAPRAYVAPPAYGVVPAYRYGPAWGGPGPYWADWD
jgi:hypothetical protein